MTTELHRIEEKIDNKFVDLQTFLNKMLIKITKHDVQILNCGEQKSRLEDTVYGNGAEGLKIRMTKMETRLRTTGNIKNNLWNNILSSFLIIGVCTSTIIGVVALKNNNKENRTEVNKELR